MEDTFDRAVALLRRAHDESRGQNQFFDRMLDSKDRVLKEFGAIFSQDGLDDLTEDDFKSFLYFENNTHWTGLHRQGPRICEDMQALRATLRQLHNHQVPAGERVEQAINSIPGMGKAIATAILHVVDPMRYGVWNSTSETALVELGLWPSFERGMSIGTKYERVNDVLNDLASSLKVDLWTLDGVLYCFLQEGGVAEPNQSTDSSSMGEARFGLERHLQEFLRDNWPSTTFAAEGWEIYSESESEITGYEYPCKIGRIDILARHRDGKRWMIIELKRNQTSDATVGQALRYIAWVRRHLAADDEPVEGVIIAYEPDEALRYALSETSNIRFLAYRVDFSLQEPSPEGE